MAHSISGNAGIAGVTISWGLGATTTDVNGNYTIPGLADGSYDVYAAIPGYYPTPTWRTVVVSGSDVPNKNFTMTPVTPASYAYAQLGADTFVQANGPASPSKWTTVATYEPLLVLNDEAVPTVPVVNGTVTHYTAAGAWPNNAYVQLKLDFISTDGSGTYIGANLRSNANSSVYSGFYIIGNPDGTISFAAGDVVGNGVAITHLSWSPGDVFRAEFYSTHVAIYQNGILLGNGECSATIYGTYGGLYLVTYGVQTDIQISDYEFGSITISSGPTVATNTEFALKVIPGDSSRDYLHLLDALGNVVGWIDPNGLMGGTLGSAGAAHPAQYAQLTLSDAKTNDYLQLLDSLDNKIGRITSAGAYSNTSGGTNTSQMILRDKSSQDFLQIKDSTGAVIGWIDATGTLKGTLAQ